MTRINAGVAVRLLVNKHLLAEHREIKRIPNLIKSGRMSNKDAPTKFTLGTGHMKFFYNKQLFLLNRYKEIYAECINRGLNVQNYESAWDGIDSKLMNDYTPTKQDEHLVIERILERLTTMGLVV